MNGKRAMKKAGANHPVKKSIRVAKAKVAKRNLREALRGD